MNGATAISVERKGAVDVLTLDRAPQLNSLNEAMLAELLAYFYTVDQDQTVGAIMLVGAGDHFCAGLDLKRDLAVLNAGAEKGMGFQREFGELILRMRRCSAPIVAGLRGAAAGGGFSIASACDVRIAGRSFRANAAFARLGLSGMEMGLSFLLPRLVGHGLASELMLTGRFIEAEEALRSGFVSRLVDDGQVEDVAFAIAEQIADNGRFATRLTKESLNATWCVTSLDAAVAFENRNQVLCFTSGAPAVAIDEFRERRGRFAREGA